MTKPNYAHDIVLVLISTVAAGTLALLGAYIGANGAIEAAERGQDRATQAQVDAEIRTQKAETYQRYIDAVNVYYNETIRIGAVVARLDDDPQSGDSVLATWENTRSEYQDSLNDVYAFGSNLAVARLRFIAQQLPGSIGKPTASDISQLRGYEGGSAFDVAFGEFQTGLCEEVNLDPSRDCGD